MNNQRLAAYLDSLPTEEARKVQVEWSEAWKNAEQDDELNYLPREEY